MLWARGCGPACVPGRVRVCRRLLRRMASVAGGEGGAVGADVAEATREALRTVGGKVAAAGAAAGHPARLVAVSKTKPAGQVEVCYEAGQRHFGENYVQELVDKAAVLPRDIRWHFIGHLQSNKTNAVTSIPNLWVVETVDSAKLATRLNAGCEKAGRPAEDLLGVMVQVNTSGEESKSGIEPTREAVQELARHIRDACPRLRLVGLMTIGMPDYTCTPENFQCLARCREYAAEALGMDAADLELSMGMSGDYEQAIAMGSTNVRVGSTIFGARSYPEKDAKAQAA